jgi:hypothetical protein
MENFPLSPSLPLARPRTCGVSSGPLLLQPEPSRLGGTALLDSDTPTKSSDDIDQTPPNLMG